MKKGSLFILVLILTSFVSFASALTATQDSLDIAIIPEFSQPGKTSLTIDGASPGTYNVYTLTAVKILPTSSFQLSAGRNSLPLDIYPTSELRPFGPAAYEFAYNIKNTESNDNYEGKMVVRIVSIEDAFEVSSDSNSPDTEKMTFYIRNRESIDLNNVHVKFSSIFFDVEQTIDIKANTKNEISIPISSDKLKKIEAGSYLLTAEFNTDKGVRTLEGRIFLGEKKGVEAKETTEGFFIKRTDISRINYGNVFETVSINSGKNVLTRLFTSFSVQPEVVNRDGFGVTYSWERKLGPAESFDVKITTNYLYPILIILAVILIIVGFRRYTQTKIEMTKSVVPVKTQSGQFALRVRISVRAKQRIENVSIIDRIPGVVQIYEKFDSILKPSKIDVKNRRIQWDLGEMAAGEERAMSYIVYSTVGVVGKFSLPRTLAVFEKGGDIHEVESNAVFFLAEQRASDE
ncbi:hypothetical protein KA107_03330 [Candidatus Pacearchaeota archaeon]|nr:hypothetical protein [Candidatus Pacearchaeota archaeon]